MREWEAAGCITAARSTIAAYVLRDSSDEQETLGQRIYIVKLRLKSLESMAAHLRFESSGWVWTRGFARPRFDIKDGRPGEGLEFVCGSGYLYNFDIWAEEVVPWHLLPHNTAQARPVVYAYSDA